MPLDMQKLAPVVLLILLSTFASISRAAPIVGYFDPFCRLDCLVNDPRIAIGNVYGGLPTVDSAILSQDGTNKAGSVSALTTTTEDATWTTEISSTTLCSGQYCSGGINSFATNDPLAFGGSMMLSKLPEPSTYVLMLAALGAIGLATRRRKGAVA
jgi:hypothetical protein